MKAWLLAWVALLLLLSPAVALDALHAAGIDRKPGAQVPIDLSFHDETGATTTLRRLADGKPLLLVPVQHHCPNICGITLAGLLQAITGQTLQPGKDFSVVAFGIDPKETPEDAHDARMRLLHSFPNFPAAPVHALTGSAANIAAVTDALGYRYAWDPDLAQYDHVAATAVLTPDGRLARWLYGIAPAPRDLQLALTEAGRGTVGSWTDQLLLLCYHYDPVTGRYSAAIWNGLRGFAGLTALALLALVGRNILRERRP